MTVCGQLASFNPEAATREEGSFINMALGTRKHAGQETFCMGREHDFS